MKKAAKISFIFLTCLLAASLLSSCCYLPYAAAKEPESSIVRQEKAPVSGAQEKTEETPAESAADKPVQEYETRDSKNIQFTISYDIEAAENTDKVVFATTVPDDYHKRQKVEEINYSPEPSRVFNDGKNKYAEFVIQDLSRNISINISSRITIYGYDLNTASTEKPDFLKEEEIETYLGQEKYIDVGEPIIADNEIIHNPAPDPVDKVKLIYDYVLDSLYYEGYNPESAGAAEALKQGSGDCTEYTDVFVALCRAAGIPARSVEGYFLPALDLYRGHNWPEVYLEEFGWVPFDPTIGDGSQEGNATTFYNLQNAYVYLSFKRNDAVLNNYHYYYYKYWGDNIEVSKNIDYLIKE
ncbi:MAG: transglutaminase-like domain-containing protein [Actinomycetota bacterium]